MELMQNFEEFLSDVDSVAEMSEKHVIFSNGTVVRVTSADELHDWPEMPFTSEYVHEWPLERLGDPESDFSPMLEANLTAFHRQLAQMQPETVHAAYNILIGAGYLRPENGDRYAVHIGGNLYHIRYPLEDKIANLVQLATTDDVAAHAAAILGGENRRLDWMYPRIISIIIPD